MASALHRGMHFGQQLASKAQRFMPPGIFPQLWAHARHMADGNVHVIREEFKKQASLYSPHPKPMDFVMSEVGVVNGDALDVASGTGMFARALASTCSRVIAFDATQEMLARAEQTAADEGICNIEYRLGDASQLPFASESFDVVTSRLAVHHFENPASMVSEMARVCRKGGQVILADIVADEDPALHAETDRLEILRDPSHTACVTLGGLHDLMESTGILQTKPHSGRVYMHPMNVQFWMDNTETPQPAREEIERTLREELAGGKRTGMQPFLSDSGELTFLHRYAVAQGIRL
eukprot:TRINITY_DN82733_c0_g1_i1.p1 TRINITY_DN82733_c0_g1~~TRINITY_DN82733_c0_g1_i1.p1  ORF type:complete len:304 (-),score=42.92 TRINITY_DN82733_c0_g1_i1:50-931(-)